MPVYQVLNALETCYTVCMRIILAANKIERSFCRRGSFDNINLQVDERDRIALVGKKWCR